MTPSEIALLSFYLVVTIANFVVFFIQRSQIQKLTSVTDQVEKYFKIINVDEFEKFIKLKEKRFETQMEIAAHDMSKKFTDSYMEKFGQKHIQKHLKKLDQELGDQMNELGWFTADWLSDMPEKERDKLIDDNFPKSKQLLIANINQINEGKVFGERIERFVTDNEKEILNWSFETFYQNFDAAFPDETNNANQTEKREFYNLIIEELKKKNTKS